MIINVALFYICDVIASRIINNYIINKDIEDFREIAKKYEFPARFSDYMESQMDREASWYDYISILNVTLSLKDLITRKQDMEYFEEQIR